MLVGIHQLHYLPWLRYFHKIARSDTFIVLDNIQYNKNGHQNRNRIKTPQGPLTLTVPVFDHFAQPLDAVLIDNKRPWAKKHWRSIEQNYRRSPYFEAYAPGLAAFYQEPWESLNELNRAMLHWFLEALAIDTPLVYASGLQAPGEATDRLIQLIQAVQGTAYFTGAHALQAYLDLGALESAGINLEIQQWHAIEYPQVHGPFVSDLSIIDLLMMCGPQSRDVLLGKPYDPPQ